MLLQVKGLIKIIVKFRTEKKYICTFLSSTRYSFEGHNILGTKYCVGKYSLKKDWINESLYCSRAKKNWHVLQIAKVHISYAIWFVISEKKYYEVGVSSQWRYHACIYQNSQKTTTHTRKCVPEFPIPSALNYYLHMYLWF